MNGIIGNKVIESNKSAWPHRVDLREEEKGGGHNQPMPLHWHTLKYEEKICPLHNFVDMACQKFFFRKVPPSPLYRILDQSSDWCYCGCSMVIWQGQFNKTWGKCAYSFVNGLGWKYHISWSLSYGSCKQFADHMYCTLPQDSSWCLIYFNGQFSFVKSFLSWGL